ncbi:MAG TPA: ATP-dependent metalloprotease, partial [Chromatiales bacterium]|nr:ATP-dependent metalloprotease [Chromatiales bacterium]
MAKNLILWVIIAIVLMSVFNNFGPRATPTQQVAYSQFLHNVSNGQVTRVVIDGRTIRGVLSSGDKFT